MEAGVSGSFAQMVADNDFAGSIQRLRGGVLVDAERLGVEVIAAVMKGTHNFLGQKHTMKYLKAGEMHLPRLAERGAWESWEAGGRLEMARRAQVEAERLLRSHQVPPLETAQERELDIILEAARKELEE
jgi:trimethylamine--corrinoid protein Co-methyltransferase